MWPNVQYDGMDGMHYLRVIMLKKLEGMALAPYPIKNRVNTSNKLIRYVNIILSITFEVNVYLGLMVTSLRFLAAAKDRKGYCLIICSYTDSSSQAL